MVERCHQSWKRKIILSPSGQLITCLCYIGIFNELIAAYRLMSNAAELNPAVLNGAVLRLSAFHYPPVMTIEKVGPGNYSYDGPAYELAMVFATFYNMTPTFVHVRASDLAEVGMKEAIVRQFKRQEIDVSTFIFEMEPNRLQYMDVSTPLHISEISLLQAWPAEENRLKVLIRPFDSTIWLCFFVSTMAFILLSTLFIRYEIKGRRHRTSSGEVLYFWTEYALTIITMQGNSVPNTTRTSLRILVAAWILSMVVITYAYTGVLTSLLAAPKLEPTVDTLDQVVTGGKLRVTAEKHGILTNFLLNATSGTSKIIGDTLRADPTLVFTEPFEMIENVLHHDCVYPGSVEYNDLLIVMDVRAFGSCRITTASKTIPFFTPIILGVAKESPYKGYEIKIILRLWTGGFGNYMMSKEIPAGNPCRVDARPQTKVQVLKLVDLAPTFLLLGVGLSISLLRFLMEIICTGQKRKRPINL